MDTSILVETGSFDLSQMTLLPSNEIEKHNGIIREDHAKQHEHLEKQGIYREFTCFC